MMPEGKAIRGEDEMKTKAILLLAIAAVAGPSLSASRSAIGRRVLTDARSRRLRSADSTGRT